MSQNVSIEAIPMWTVGDRLRKALSYAGVSNAEMAQTLGVSPNTVGNYIADRTKANRSTLVVWAMRTGVPVEWLEHGIEPHNGDDGGGAAVNTDEYLPQIAGTAHVMPLRRAA